MVNVLHQQMVRFVWIDFLVKQKSMRTNLYVLDWGNGMVGIFRDSDLSQVGNSTKESFVGDLRHVMRTYNMNATNIQFLESHEELQRLRESRNLGRKPTLDEYLKSNEYDISTMTLKLETD